MDELVSVIIPCYNASEFIDKAILSILSQTYKNIEVILAYDNSLDDTLSRLKYYESIDNRVSVVYSDGFNRLAGALNKAISASKGNYILRMDADDIAQKDKLENQLAYFHNYPEVSIVGSFITFIDEKGRFINHDTYLTVTQPLSCLFFAMFENPLVHPSVLCRRSLFKNHQYAYPNTTSTSEDYRLWVKILIDNYRIANLSNRYLEYRRNSKSASSVNRTKMNEEHVVIAQELFSHILPDVVNDQYHRIVMLRYNGIINIRAINESIYWLITTKNTFLQKYQGQLSPIEIQEINTWICQRIIKINTIYFFKLNGVSKLFFLLNGLHHANAFFKVATFRNIYYRVPYFFNKIFL